MREKTSQRRHQRVWCTRHGGFQMRYRPMVPAPMVAIVAYNPLQTHSSTLTTPGDHQTAQSKHMHACYARNDVETKAPERVVYVAWRFPNALQADGTGSYGRHSGIKPSKHIARLSQRLMTITQLRAGICTPYVRATTSTRRHQCVWCTRHGGF